VNVPEALARCLQDTLFFAYEFHYFSFAKPRQRHDGMTVRATEALNLLYIFDNYVLDLDRRELRSGATVVAMEPQVFDLLVHLIRRREHVVSRGELIESIWGGRIVSESALSTRINAVRCAIGDSGTEQRLIKTLPRKGVRFVGEVREERKPSEALSANSPQRSAAQPIDVRQAIGGLPATQAQGAEIIIGHSQELSPVIPASRGSRRFFASRAMLASIAAIGVLCLSALAWSYFARSAQSERTRANIETAARLIGISETINMTSREDYEAARALRQWAVDLDPHHAEALADLTFAIVTGVLNHWSSDEVADLHAADLALQDALAIAPANKRVRGAQCQILRGMRQFEAAIKACSELAQNFPGYAFLHKEIGYDKLMMGQSSEALPEFLEADRLEPNSRLRWSWQQGIGLVYLMEGQDQKAIDWLSRAALEAPNAGNPAAFLASAYALVGREQEAHEALAHYLKLWPNTTLQTFEPSIGTVAFNSNMQRVLEGLRLAGMPE
jgi:DNA-binding winged helix-turn-helix (wHTH) protein/tetratricopeptide (TPR) repeat protein